MSTKTKTHLIPSTHEKVGRFKPETPLKRGDFLRSPCDNGMIVEVLEVEPPMKGRQGQVVEVQTHGERQDFVYQATAHKGRNDFPSWTLYRKRGRR